MGGGTTTRPVLAGSGLGLDLEWPKALRRALEGQPAVSALVPRQP